MSRPSVAFITVEKRASRFRAVEVLVDDTRSDVRWKDFRRFGDAADLGRRIAKTQSVPFRYGRRPYEKRYLTVLAHRQDRWILRQVLADGTAMSSSERLKPYSRFDAAAQGCWSEHEKTLLPIFIEVLPG